MLLTKDGGFFFIVCKIKLEPRDTSDQIVQFFAFGLNITFLVFRGTIFYREIIGSVSYTLAKI